MSTNININLIENIKLFVPVRLAIKRKHDLNDLESIVLATIESIIQLTTNDKTCYCGYSDESLGEIIGKKRTQIATAIKILKEKELIIIVNPGTKGRKIYLTNYLQAEEEKIINSTDGQAYLKTIETQQKTIIELQEQIKKLNYLMDQANYIIKPNQFTQMLIEQNYLSKNETNDNFIINEYNILLLGYTQTVGIDNLKKLLYYILVKRKEQSNKIKIKDKFKWLDASIRNNYNRFNKPKFQMSWDIETNDIIEEEIININDDKE